MKQYKKILAVALALALALAIAVPAFAVDNASDPAGSGSGDITVSTDGSGKTTITVDNISVPLPEQQLPSAKEDISNHTFDVYQIFTGSYASGDKTSMTSIKWGSGIADAKALCNDLKDNFLTVCQSLPDGDKVATNPFAALTYTTGTNPKFDQSAFDVAKIVADWDDYSPEAYAFARIVARNLSGTRVKTGAKFNETIPNPAPGYYLVVDNGAPAGQHSRNLSVLMWVDGSNSSLVIESKVEVPKMDKQVLEFNDSTMASGGWGKVADYDVLDNVPFLLTGTLPSDYANYQSYYYRFDDTMTGGLVLNEKSVKVLVDNVVVEGYTLSVASNRKSFSVIFPDLKTIAPNATAGSVVQVVYTAKLSDNGLVIGAGGNVNTARLVFSNDPNLRGDGNGPTPTPSSTPNPTPTPPGPNETPNPTPTPPPGTGETPEEKVTVFTFQIVANKVDENGTALKGAEFTLYKQEGFENGAPVYTEVNTLTSSAPANDPTTFTFQGLDAGEYKLEESKVPDGYNKAEDIFFTVAATYTKDTPPKLATLKIENVRDANNQAILDMAGAADANGNLPTLVFEPDLNAGSLTTSIVNLTGVLLPSTGGIGTTIFYVIGGLLVLAAVVLLITKKRMGNQDKPE